MIWVVAALTGLACGTWAGVVYQARRDGQPIRDVLVRTFQRWLP